MLRLRRSSVLIQPLLCGSEEFSSIVYCCLGILERKPRVNLVITTLAQIKG